MHFKKLKNLAIGLVCTAAAGIFAQSNSQLFVKDEGVNEANAAKPRIYFVNGSQTLNGLEFRYFITSENGKIPQADDYYLPEGSVSIVNVHDDNYYVKYSFPSVSLAPGGRFPSSDGFIAGIHYSDWSTFDKTNDYSTVGSGSWIPSEKIAVYSNGSIIYGSEPDGTVPPGDTPPPETNLVGKVILSEVYYNTLPGDFSSIMIKNISGSSLDLPSTTLRGQFGNITIPAFQNVPVDGKIKVIFDGQTVNDNSFLNDALVVIHVPVATIGTNNGGGLVLFSANSKAVSFVAWGIAPTGELHDSAVANKIWKPGSFVMTADNVLGPVALVQPGYIIGVRPGTNGLLCSDWAVYPAPGMASSNKYPVPQFYAQSEKQVIIPDVNKPVFTAQWTPVAGATSYRIQVAGDAAFSNLIVDDTVDASSNSYPISGVTENTVHHYRVAAGYEEPSGTTGFSIFSDIATIIATAVRAAGAIGVNFDTFPMPVLAALKDTRMLDVCPVRRLPYNEPNHEWDRPHAVVPDAAGNIFPRACESWRCWDVWATGVNHYYGGNITEDEVMYLRKRQQGVTDPEFDQPRDSLAGDFPRPAAAISMQLSGESQVEVRSFSSNPIDTNMARFLVANRIPFYMWHDRHIMTISGYEIRNDSLFLLHRNVDNCGTSQWRYIDLSDKKLNEYGWVPLTRVNNPLMSDPLIQNNTDTDGDGVLDWDETNRFGTSNFSTDSDGDGVPDKAEIFAYAERADVGPDDDFDGLRAEKDYDSDNGGLKDGDEDLNGNGVVDPGETDPFDPLDDKPNQLPIVSYPGSYIFYGFNHVQLNDRASARHPSFLGTAIAAPVASTGTFQLGAFAKSGNVKCYGDATLRSRSYVSGYVHSGAKILPQDNSNVVTNGTAENMPLPLLELVTSIPVGSYDMVNVASGVTVKNGQVIKLAPGSYDNVILETGARLVVSPGVYYINNFRMEPNSFVECPTYSGSFRFFIGKTMVVKGTFVTPAGQPMSASALFFGYLGTTGTFLDNFTGTVVAPNADVSVGQSGKKFTGCLVAKTIVVHQDVIATYMGFDKNYGKWIIH
jgi:hypothetical protein